MEKKLRKQQNSSITPIRKSDDSRISMEFVKNSNQNINGKLGKHITDFGILHES